MEMIHTSPVKIEKITKNGMFDDCLFFSYQEYVMTGSSTYYTYMLEIDDDNIVDIWDLDEASSVVADLAEYVGCDIDLAEDLLIGRKSEWNIDYDGDRGDLGWHIQAERGRAAKLLGYEACRDEDEQGTVYIVPMFGREKDLVLLEK